MSKKTYVIDIDGVIGTKMKWTKEDSYLRAKEMFAAIPVNMEVVEVINEKYRRGHSIILHTSRHWYDFDVTSEWLASHGVLFHTLVMGKPLGDYYIDDRNMSIKEFLVHD